MNVILGMPKFKTCAKALSTQDKRPNDSFNYAKF